MQEHAFALLTIMMYAGSNGKDALKEAMRSRSSQVLAKIMSYIENATYKCEHASGENASECLSLLVSFDEIQSTIRSDTNMLRYIVSFGGYMQGQGSMAKFYIVQTL